MIKKTFRPPVEVVVTIPQPFGLELGSELGLRTTLGVLTELLANAKKSVILASPFIQGNEALHAGPIGMALVAALKRGVAVDIMSTEASLGAVNLDDLKAVSGGKLRTFQPRPNMENSKFLGSHAKICLCDLDHAYIGSANITQNGITGHLEIGVIITGAPVITLSRLISKLIDSDFFVPV